MFEIFVSYKREERERAKMIAEALEACGFTVWWDGDLLPGQKFRQEIEEISKNCRAMVVLWSRLSAKSDWVLDEAQRGKQAGKLIPVRIDDDDEVPPLGFRQSHTHDLIAWNGEVRSDAFEPIIAAAERLVGRKRKALKPKRTQSETTANEPSATEREVLMWKGIQESRDAGDFEAYLASFGEKGLFGSLARRRIEALREKQKNSRLKQWRTGLVGLTGRARRAGGHLATAAAAVERTTFEAVSGAPDRLASEIEGRPRRERWRLWFKSRKRLLIAFAIVFLIGLVVASAGK